jgi:hypothetical protein
VVARRDKNYIVAHRVQCKYQHGYVIEVPQEDFISIEEAMEYTGIVTNPKDYSNNDTLSDGSYQVSSSSVPQLQIAKLHEASPTAKRHPNAI